MARLDCKLRWQNAIVDVNSTCKGVAIHYVQMLRWDDGVKRCKLLMEGLSSKLQMPIGGEHCKKGLEGAIGRNNCREELQGEVAKYNCWIDLQTLSGKAERSHCAFVESCGKMHLRRNYYELQCVFAEANCKMQVKKCNCATKFKNQIAKWRCKAKWKHGLRLSGRAEVQLNWLIVDFNLNCKIRFREIIKFVMSANGKGEEKK